MSGIYIHIPFCEKKCRYCDFVSGVYGEDIRKKYFSCLENEITVFFENDSRIYDSVFIGGGTPSCADALDIFNILEIIKNNCRLANDTEISIEINPGTVSKDKFEVYKAAGINRFSVGLQSDDDSLLKSIGRIHTRDDFDECIKMLEGENINADIIYALPGQTLAQLCSTAGYITSLPLSHISAYSLIIEPGTPLGHDVENGKYKPVPDELDREMYYLLRECFEKKGFYQYEISNFAKKGYECRHNLKYWTGEDYIGFGVAAHSKLGNIRYANTSVISEYLDKNGLSREVTEILGSDENEREYIMLRLRLTKGFELSDFEKRFGQGFMDKYADAAGRLIDAGFILNDGTNVSLSQNGMDIQNQILIELGI